MANLDDRHPFKCEKCGNIECRWVNGDKRDTGIIRKCRKKTGQWGNRIVCGGRLIYVVKQTRV